MSNHPYHNDDSDSIVVKPMNRLSVHFRIIRGEIVCYGEDYTCNKRVFSIPLTDDLFSQLTSAWTEGIERGFEAGKKAKVKEISLALDQQIRDDVTS